MARRFINIREKVRRQNEIAEREAELSRVKARLWRRFSAALDANGLLPKPFLSPVPFIPHQYSTPATANPRNAPTRALR